MPTLLYYMLCWSLSLLVLLLAVQLTAAHEQPLAPTIPPLNFTFFHPGTLIGPSEIDHMELKITRQDASVQDLFQTCYPDLALPSNASHRVYVPYNPAKHDLEQMPENRRRMLEEMVATAKSIRQSDAGIRGHEFTLDGTRAYQHSMAYIAALMRNASNAGSYALKAQTLLDNWASQCTQFGPPSQNGPLEAGWGLASMARSMELLKYFYDEFDRGVELRFVNFTESVLMPNLRYFDGNFSAVFNNWGTTILAARLQYAILRENRSEWDFVMDTYPRLLEAYTEPSGRVKETSRDIVHAQFAMGGMINICEMAYHQGNSSLYGLLDNRLMRVMEYHARVLSGDRPEDMSADVQLNWVKHVNASWQIGYHHYTKRMKLEMPFTRSYLQSLNTTEGYSFHWGLGSFTHFTGW